MPILLWVLRGLLEKDIWLCIYRVFTMCLVFMLQGKSDHWTFIHAPSIIVITNSYTLFFFLIPVLWATKDCCSHFTDKDLMPKED